MAHSDGGTAAAGVKRLRGQKPQRISASAKATWRLGRLLRWNPRRVALYPFKTRGPNHHFSNKRMISGLFFSFKEIKNLCKNYIV